MKFIRTLPQVIIDARNGAIGIAAVKINKFTYRDGIIQLWINYLHQVPVANPVAGQLIYDYKPVPTPSGNNGELSFTFTPDEINALFAMLNISILPSDVFCDNFSQALLQALLFKTVQDEIFRKIDENNVISKLVMEDWETVASDEIYEPEA